MNPIKVLITDDHQIILDGLQSLLKDSAQIMVIAEARNGREALQHLTHLTPDVVLMDIDMPVMNGIEALKEIRKSYPAIRVIILSMHSEAGMIKSLMDLGANGYLLKSCSREELCNALVTVANGHSFFSTDVTLSLLKPNQGNVSLGSTQTEALSDRETEIIRLIAAGFSNKEIGEKLFISHRTVDTHRTNMMKKLNVSNIAGLISYSIRHGLV